MKITKSQLKRIIKEELKKVLMSEAADPAAWSYGSSLDPNELRRMADQMEAIPPEAFGDWIEELMAAEKDRFIDFLSPGLKKIGANAESLKHKLDMMDEEDFQAFQKKMADELLAQHEPWTPTSKDYIDVYERSASIAVKMLGMQADPGAAAAKGPATVADLNEFLRETGARMGRKQKESTLNRVNTLINNEGLSVEGAIEEVLDEFGI
jgi:hypothetical protein